MGACASANQPPPITYKASVKKLDLPSLKAQFEAKASKVTSCSKPGQDKLDLLQALISEEIKNHHIQSSSQRLKQLYSVKNQVENHLVPVNNVLSTARDEIYDIQRYRNDENTAIVYDKLIKKISALQPSLYKVDYTVALADADTLISGNPTNSAQSRISLEIEDEINLSLALHNTRTKLV